MHPSDCKMSLSLALLAIQAERVPLFLPCEPRTLKEKRLCYADYAPGFLSAACRHVESPQVDLKALAALASRLRSGEHSIQRLNLSRLQQSAVSP